MDRPPVTIEGPTIPPVPEDPPVREDRPAWDLSLPSYWGQSDPIPTCGALPTFQDEEQLRSRVGEPPEAGWGSFWWGSSASGLLSTASLDYSPTNNQVEGVDEADIVKTDGQYIYFAAGNIVGIARAYPPEEAALLTLTAAPGPVLGLFVSGDRLVVLVSGWFADPLGTGYSSSVVRLRVYDISDRAAPRIVHEIAVQGDYMGARMIDEYVYLVATGFVAASGEDLVLPAVWTDGTRRDLTYTDVGYHGGTWTWYGLVFLLSVRVAGGATDGCLETILTPASYGYSTDIYVSEGNIYLAFLEYSWDYNPGNGGEQTIIHRFPVSDGRIAYGGRGAVPGTVLNQFSLDEFEGFLRVATSVGWGTSNDLYVLDEDLVVVGRLQGLAPGEHMHSARFMGTRAYLVTFKKIDPFFVIDLSDPYAPRLVGELKIPGFSDYLHPFGDTHVIGLGKDAYNMGNFAWFQGLKLSLFDVGDPENPQETAQLVIGDRGTDSEARSDHRAFLFDPVSGLLVLPVDLAIVDREENPNAPPEAYGRRVWQGVYVLSLSIDEGFTIRGRISHSEGSGNLGPCYGLYMYYGCDPFRIRRSLYIENYLYTVSDAAIEIHNLETLVEAVRISL
jgi:hypothetical protein